MSYYVWFGLFAILGYLIVTDASVAKYVVLLGKEAKLNYEKLKWWVRWWVKYNPNNPIVRFQIRRNADKLARELFNEQQNKINSGSSTDQQSDNSTGEQ